MRTLALALTLASISALSACASNEQQSSNKGSANTAASNTTVTTRTTQTTNTPPVATDDGSLVAPAHGGSNTGSTPPASSNPSAGEQTGIDTSALDAKIAKAEEKAHAQNATQADKLAAAAAYMERADIFMNAGRPALYKYALRDYRRTLRYQPDNQQAQNSVKTIVDIYKSLGRPVPELGNEP